MILKRRNADTDLKTRNIEGYELMLNFQGEGLKTLNFFSNKPIEMEISSNGERLKILLSSRYDISAEIMTPGPNGSIAFSILSECYIEDNIYAQGGGYFWLTKIMDNEYNTPELTGKIIAAGS